MKHQLDMTLVDVAMGDAPPDTVITGARVVNVFSGELEEAAVAIANGCVASVGDVAHLAGPETEIHDMTGRFLMPGFVDGHQHIEDTRMSVTRFSDAVVPTGTTSVISGLDHVIVVAGLRGLRAFLDEAGKTDLNVFWGSPFRLPYTDPPATVGFGYGEAEQREAQSWPECIGVWELVPDFLIDKDPDTVAALQIARDRGLGVFGSVPWAGEKLDVVAAHVAAGLRVDHEAYDEEELLAKIRMGLFTLIRDSHAEHFLEALIGLFVRRPELAVRAGFCTDGSNLTDVRANGHLNRLVKEAVAAGVPAMTAIQMATINTATAYRIDHIVGSLAPGRRADILVTGDLDSFECTHVFAGGRLVARDGEMLEASTPPRREAFLVGPFARAKVDVEELRVPCEMSADVVRVRTIELTDNAFHRRLGEAELTVSDGSVDPDPELDLALVSYVERFGKSDGAPGTAFVKGFGLQRGAFASSCCADDENILCVGTNSGDMAVAINTLIERGGGEVVVDGREVVAFLALPVGGIVSDLPVHELHDELLRLERAVGSLGCDIEYPFPFLALLGITAIPDCGLSEHGLIDAVSHERIDVVIEAVEAGRA